ncbi:hypothetical protein JCM11641_000260 [Rhodosporidiobolus odoratus]
MILRHILAATEKPIFLSKHHRRPSATPILPSLVASSNRGTRGRWFKLVSVAVVVYWIVIAARFFFARPPQQVKAMTMLRGDSCEAQGSVTSRGAEEDQQRVSFKLRPALASASRLKNPDNTILPAALNSQLAAVRAELFDDPSPSLASAPVPARRQKCLKPETHTLPLLPTLEPLPHEPQLFFTACTTPSRAVTAAPIWRHFMTSSEDGCLVTDAQGQGDGRGMAQAKSEFGKHGLSCRMQDSSRAGERYEQRVLGNVRDAWIESERRRWQDGQALTEWFIFMDDDTWFTDAQMLRTMISGYDWREDHFFGGFSETKGNFELFGKIAYGGAGMIMSRSLVRKMQSKLDDCSSRFKDTFGGDGLISKCAALAMDVPLEQAVEEVPAMRQMDMRGDASGFLAGGIGPFLTLHHWAGWLSLFPTLDGISSIHLLTAAVDAVGGPNFLRRWVFDDGAVSLALGYAITVYRDALSPEDLQKTERTWENHEPRRPSREKKEEGRDKLTYYLSSVERLTPDLALLRHTLAPASISNTTLHHIDLLYDVRPPKPSWKERILGSSGQGATAAPSLRVHKAMEQQRERLFVEQRERDGEGFRGREKVKRVVEFSA